MHSLSYVVQVAMADADRHSPTASVPPQHKVICLCVRPDRPLLCTCMVHQFEGHQESDSGCNFEILKVHAPMGAL